MQLLSTMYTALLVESLALDSKARCGTPLQLQPEEELITTASPCFLAGWPDVDAYYQGSGSCWMVPKVTIPLLCIQVGVSRSAAFQRGLMPETFNVC